MDREISLSSSELDMIFLSPLLEGRLDDLPSLGARAVRVFVSSTFRDVAHERNVLMEDAYPRLKEYCRGKYGLEFQLVDLRWGIPSECLNDHSTSAVCMREIDRCRRHSFGPFFALILGQRYGYRPLAAEIPEVEYAAICRSLPDCSLLDKWYLLDSNVDPPVRILQPISTFIPQFTSSEGSPEQLRASQTWTLTSEQLKKLVRSGAKAAAADAILSEQQLHKYFRSVTEHEVAEGILECQDVVNRSFIIDRFVENLEKLPSQSLMEGNEMPKSEIREQVGEKGENGSGGNIMRIVRRDFSLERNDKTQHKHQYLDFLSDGSVDQMAITLLERLRDRILTESNVEVVATPPLHWNGTTSPTADPIYLAEFSNMFVNMVCHCVDKEMLVTHQLLSNSRVIEIVQQLELCKQRCHGFVGRNDLIRLIYCKLENSRSVEAVRYPIVIYGESGCGKTSLVAKLAEYLPRHFDGGVLVLRFLGTSLNSTSIRHVLSSLCWQISLLYSAELANIPAEFTALVAHFHQLLGRASSEKPLLLMLDSLDQLSSNYHSQELTWLPIPLPAHCYLILSTLPVDRGILTRLHSLLPAESDNFVELKSLGPVLGAEIVKMELCESRRKLTEKQHNILLEAFEECSLPLYVRLVLERARTWHSYSKDIFLPRNIHGIIMTMLEVLEKNHGKIFVKHTLAYITASRKGLSDSELEDILSLDDCVLDSVFKLWIPSSRRIPPLLWSRLHHDLGSYMSVRESNGVAVNWWYHQQFIECAREKYLGDSDFCIYIHNTLADYFLGTWGRGREKPFGLKGEQADRRVPEQPLTLGRRAVSPLCQIYNLRKLNELPYQLILARRFDDLRQHVLFNYDWLHACLSTTSLQDVLSDFSFAISQELNSPDIQLLYQALRLGGSFVNSNPSTLSFDLLARLLPLYESSPWLRQFLYDCDGHSIRHSALTPLLPCFEAPRGMLLYILEEHTRNVVDVTFSPRTDQLISIALDGKLYFWELHTGELRRTIDVTEIQPGPGTRLLLSRNYQFLVCDSDTIDTPALIFDVETGALLHRCGRKTPDQNRCIVGTRYLVRQSDVVDLQNGFVLESLDEFSGSKKFFVMASFTRDEQKLLLGETDSLQVHNFPDGPFEGSIPLPHCPSFIESSVDSKSVYVGFNNPFYLRVHSLAEENFASLILQFNPEDHFEVDEFPKVGFPHQRELSRISICPNDPSFLLLNVGRQYLMTLSVKTGKAALMSHRDMHFDENFNIFQDSFSHNGMYVIAGETNLVYIWESVNGDLLSTINVHSVFQFPLAVSTHSGLFATGSNVHTAIKLWELDRMTEPDPARKLKIYDYPVELLSAASTRRLLFVKRCYGLNSVEGYRHNDYFGIDVWNLSTGSVCEFLPFKRLGKLLNMYVTNDASRILLLVKSRLESYLCVWELTKDTPIFLSHQNAESLLVSEKHNLCTTYVYDEDHPEINLWDNHSQSSLITEVWGQYPVFTSNFFVFLNKKHHLYTRTLDSGSSRTHRFAIPDIIAISGMNQSTDSLIVYSRSQRWHVFDVVSQTVTYTVESMARPCSFSADGLIFVDSFLVVHDMVKKKQLMCIELDGSQTNGKMNGSIIKHIRITEDGQYAVWVEDLSIRACRLSDGKIIGNVSTHESVECLEMLDGGYTISAGRVDGHLLTIRLRDEQETKEGCSEQNALRRLNDTLEERINRLLCDRARNAHPLDEVEPIDDHQLPVAGLNVVHELEARAKVPVAVLCTSDPEFSQTQVQFPRRPSRLPRDHSLLDLLFPMNVVRSS